MDTLVQGPLRAPSRGTATPKGSPSQKCIHTATQVRRGSSTSHLWPLSPCFRGWQSPKAVGGPSSPSLLFHRGGNQSPEKGVEKEAEVQGSSPLPPAGTWGIDIFKEAFSKQTA